MTVDTQLLLSVLHKTKLIFRAHGIMAGRAGHGMAGPYIQNIRTDGMSKGPLGLMAADTDLRAVAFEQCQFPTAVGFMAVAALINIIMLIGAFPECLHGALMT